MILIKEPETKSVTGGHEGGEKGAPQGAAMSCMVRVTKIHRLHCLVFANNLHDLLRQDFTQILDKKNRLTSSQCFQ